MSSTIDKLNHQLRDIFDHRLFKLVIGAIIFLNPIALVPQVKAVFVAPSVEGLSLTMWLLFAVIQVAMMLEGIRVRSAPMFWSMLVSFVETSTIILVILWRS